MFCTLIKFKYKWRWLKRFCGRGWVEKVVYATVELSDPFPFVLCWVTFFFLFELSDLFSSLFFSWVTFFFLFFKTERPPSAAIVLLIPESGRSGWVRAKLCQAIIHTTHLGSKIKIVLAIKSNMSKQIVFQKWPEVPRTPNPGRSRQLLIHTSSAHRLCGKNFCNNHPLIYLCIPNLLFLCPPVSADYQVYNLFTFQFKVMLH